MSITGKREKKIKALDTLVKAGLKPVISAASALKLFELLVVACNYLKPDDPAYAYKLICYRLYRIHTGRCSNQLPPLSGSTESLLEGEGERMRLEGMETVNFDLAFRRDAGENSAE